MKPSIYQIFPRLELNDRQWPNNTIKQAPIWCSIDLRDGNQALPKPMDLNRKLRLFKHLVTLGFKHIEVAAPGVSDDEYRFTRHLIEHDLIPPDVSIQVIAQMKSAHIEKAFDAIKGAKQAIVHLYNTTSALRRNDIYEAKEACLIERAVEGFRLAMELKAGMPETKVLFEYSPEGFNTTEPTSAAKICNAVIHELQPTSDEPLILNLQATVEVDLPNHFADQVEWLQRQLSHREALILSVQPHNDRGCAVAAAELAQLAGAMRIEGSLLGNGERAGNACLLTLALNLYTQGIDPQLDISDINSTVDVFEDCTELDVSPRHPYAGSLVFTTFTAPHQFAINEALTAYSNSDKREWLVPYLPMDPDDIGRSQENLIRLNVQSGRSGVNYIMEKYYGYRFPKGMQHEFSHIIKQYAKVIGTEVTHEMAWKIFSENYLEMKQPLELKSIYFEKDKEDKYCLHCHGEIMRFGEGHQFNGKGNGAVDTLSHAIQNLFEMDFSIDDYQQHVLGHGSHATAVSYLKLIRHTEIFWGVGIDNDATLASLKSLISAINRAFKP